MAAVARLRAVLGLDPKEFKAGIRNAKSETTSFQSQIAKVGAAIGVAFSVAAVVRMGRALMTWATDVSLAARNVGILTSEMMALNEIAVQSGLKTRDLQSIMGRLEGELFGAATGTQKLKDIYGELGLTLDRLFASGMDPVKRLQMVGRAALDSANPTGALAQIFGQRLGPNARVALSAIVEGLRDVDRATGEAADKLEGLGSWFARQKEAGFKAGADFLAGIGGAYRDGSVMLAEFLANPFITTEEWAKRSEEAIRNELLRTERERGKIDEARRQEAEEMIEMIKSAAEKEAQARIDAEQSINDEIQRQRLEGLDRMRSDHEQEIEALKTRMETVADKEREVIQERIQLLNQYYQEDVQKFEQSQREKAQSQIDAIVRPMEAELERLQEQAQSIAVTTRGQGAGGDSMSRVGGMLGGERPGMGVLDKQLQVQRLIEQNTKQQLEVLRRRESALGGDGLGMEP